MRPHLSRVPSVATELLRLFLMLFGAALGYTSAGNLGAQSGRPMLGILDGYAVGVVVGAGLFYSFGGVIARQVLRSLDKGERRLDRLSPDEVVAGAFGGFAALLAAAALTWPIFLLLRAIIAVPLMLFVVLVAALFGFRVARTRRHAVLDQFTPRQGLSGRTRPASSLSRVIDTSVAIDGRVIDVVRAGFIPGRLLVPTPVLDELQGLADAGDLLRRSKGRRGLEVLETLQTEPGVELVTIPDEAPGVAEVDAKLIRICLDRNAALLTLDTNLAKVAGLAGVRVMNLHALALALRPPVVVGDEVNVLLTRAGKEPGQGVGYLDDGTMVVVEDARAHVGNDAKVQVTSVLTTANGRLVFARLATAPANDRGHVASGLDRN
ncbi:MAG: TRAM domain-containing protein [Actinomycetes bacterium]